MKRLLFLLFVAIALTRFSVAAQDTNALPPELEEKIKRLTSDMDTLLAANVELQKKIATLSDELAQVREQQARAANNSAVDGVREDLRKLADQIQEVDKKRADDNRRIAEEVENIGKAVKSFAEKAARAQARPPREITPEPAAPTDKPGLTYVIREGDTLSEIIQAANAQLKEKGKRTVTLQQVLDANPGLKPTSMRINQKIVIPVMDK